LIEGFKAFVGAKKAKLIKRQGEKGIPFSPFIFALFTFFENKTPYLLNQQHVLVL